MKKPLCIFLVLCVLASVPWLTFAQRPLGQGKLMADKLESTKALLEGIAIADFKKIGDSSERLVQLSRKDEWFIYKTPRYELHSNEFRRAAETISQKAKEKNIDGVTLAYFDLTMSCVRCHQHVRETRDARLPVPKKEFFAWAD